MRLEFRAILLPFEMKAQMVRLEELVQYDLCQYFSAFGDDRKYVGF